MSPILVTPISDSNFERSNISFKEDKLDGVDPNSNGYLLLRSKERRKNSTVFQPRPQGDSRRDPGGRRKVLPFDLLTGEQKIFDHYYDYAVSIRSQL